MIESVKTDLSNEILSTTANDATTNELTNEFSQALSTASQNFLPPGDAAPLAPIPDGTQITPEMLGLEAGAPSPTFFFEIAELIYLRDNPDVAAAVAAGDFLSGLGHFSSFGADEGRAMSVFNESAYLAQNPDVAAAVESGAFTSGEQHYLQFGFAEGRGIIGPEQSITRVNIDTQPDIKSEVYSDYIIQLLQQSNIGNWNNGFR